jgi:hypothetical protein
VRALRSAAWLTPLICVAGCQGSLSNLEAPGRAGGEFTVVAESSNRFQLGQSSYVAIFEIIHRRGVVMTYPLNEAQAVLMDRGVHVINYAPSASESDWLRRQRLRFAAGSGGRGSILVVASAWELPVQEYLEDPNLLADRLGDAALDEGEATAGILDLMISDREATDWGWSWR